MSCISLLDPHLDFQIFPLWIPNHPRSEWGQKWNLSGENAPPTDLWANLDSISSVEFALFMQIPSWKNNQEVEIYPNGKADTEETLIPVFFCSS